MTGFTTSGTLSVLINKFQMRKRRKNAKKKKKKRTKR